MQDLLSRLGLGAAQFRFEQAGPRGRAPAAEIAEILSIAARSGLSILDASTPFAGAEQMLGEAMLRPTPFRLSVRTARCDRGPEFVEAQARASLARLGVDRADAIIVEAAGDLFSPYGPGLWDKLQDLKDQGLFARVGVATHASDDPVGLVRRFKPDIIQAPVSLLDQRLLIDGSLAACRDLGAEVHFRSVFLQGLLFLPLDRMPAGMKSVTPVLSRVRRMIAEGRSDPLQAALGFALSRPEASAVIVGVATAAELSAVVAAAAKPPPDLDWNAMAVEDLTAIDQRRWDAA